MGEPYLLDVKHLTKIYPTGIIGRKHIVAVDDVSFNLPGDKSIITALAGESGSGKTTIAKIVLGLLKPTSGEVLYKGKNIFKMSKKEFFNYRKEVQAIFQDPYGTYNPFYKVNRILELPIKKFGLASSKSEVKKMIAESLMTVGLSPEEVLGKYPHELSGGQRQRIMLARVFLLKPRLIIADEPVSMLDASLRAEVLDVFQKFRAEFGISSLYITHDLSVAYYLSDNILILYRGKVVEMGDIDAVVKTPAHPYTQALIKSIPIPNPEKRWRERLKLDLESFRLTEVRSGCAFYDRCPKAMEVCAKNKPEMVEIEKNHYVSCHLYT
ncbi:ABC transporter ATP-binding protein [Candidatus Bathyarchaeota archaeon]|nr:MAG: ABC transporter ATP-binding protein [Candidatus Bathyarchaeota archaeon]